MARTPSHALPPGPRTPRPVQTVAALRDPVGFLCRCRRRYGPVFSVRMVGTPRLVYVADAGMARRVFGTDRDVGRAGQARAPLLEPLVGSHSLLCLDGEPWVRQRRFLGSALHGEHIAGYPDQIAAIAAEHVRDWPVGEAFGLRPRMQAITLDVILRVVFGVRDAPRVERLRRLLPALLAAADTGGMLAALPAGAVLERLLARVPAGPVARFAALLAETDRILHDEIRRRRATAEDPMRTDILSVLLRARDEDGAPMSDIELRDELMTLVVAGHETTATALAWAFERLVRHPGILALLTDGDPGYLDAVITETLRVRPVFSDMPRVLAAPFEVGGFELPAGTMVSPAATLLHHDPTEFADPGTFRPERFLTDGPVSQAWIPFGGGRRQCTGRRLARMEMVAVIPVVLSHRRLRAAGDLAAEPIRLRNGTLAPARDARVVAEVIPPAGDPP